MNKKKGFPKLFKKLGIYAFWLLVWQLLAVFFHNDILLVGPEKTLRTFFSCLITAGFWRSIWFSISRICIGFFLAMLLGILTGALSCRFRIVGEFLEPPIQFMKSIPVASFVILALIWTGSKNLSILISFLVAYPILHISTGQRLKKHRLETFGNGAGFSGSSFAPHPLYLPFTSPSIPAFRPFPIFGIMLEGRHSSGGHRHPERLHRRKTL